MSQVVSNPVEFSDWAALKALLSAAFAEQEGRINPPSSHHGMTSKDLAAKAATEDLFVLLDPLRGCLFGKPDGAVYALSKWAIDPRHAGTGLGRALAEAASQRARDLGCERLQLGTRIELLENHRVFRAFGFRLMHAGRHRGFTRPSYFIFEKDLRLPRPR